MILGLDTTTDICSVALFDHQGVIIHKDSERDFSHAASLNRFIVDCLHSADVQLNQLKAISIASGPGSYTGLRVGASAAKGLCFGLNLPLIAIDSLTSLAHGCEKKLTVGTLILPMIDARRDEVYTAVFDSSLKRQTDIHKLIIDEAFFEEFTNDVILCGNGYEKFIGKLSLRNCTFGHKDSSAATLWKPTISAYDQQLFEQLDLFSPFYLSDPNITASKKNIFI